MPLMTCPECHQQFSDGLRACIHCGSKRPRTIGGFGLAALFVAGLVVMWAFSLSSSPQGQAKASERDAIARCWQAQQKQSVSGFCEALEQRYREKWGANP